MIRKLLFVMLAILATLQPTRGESTNDSPLVYIIPVKDMIEPALLYVVRRGVDEAVRNDADAIIFHMDTPGGVVDSAEGIIKVISHTDIPTYTFIEGEAYSAGAIIALATPNIYMAKGSVIGAATPYLSSSGGVQELPESVEEKMVSAVAAMVRATAEQGGYDPKLAEAMVRADIEYVIDGEIISEEGRLLTLTNTEAERLVGADKKPLLSKGTVADIDDMLRIVGLEGAEKRELQVTASERIARFLVLPQIAGLLSMLGLIGLWMEFQKPGFGIFGIVGISAFLLLYLGHHIAGMAGNEEIIILIAGLVLLGLEIFVIPGFGVAGISGLFLIFAALISMMVERLPGSWRPISFEWPSFSAPILTITMSFISAVVIVIFLGRFLPQTKMFHSLTLTDVVPDDVEDQSLVGQKGVSHSELRPGGTAYFQEKKVDVVTRGDFIPRETEVVVVEVHGNRIVVEKSA